MTRRAWRCAFLLLLGAASGAAPAAAACVGDCDGNGAVTINELITGVRISLGSGTVDDCLAFDATPDGELRINELIIGVGNGLSGCPATPTATATAPNQASPTVAETATATPTPQATGTATLPGTPTATPTLPAVAGTWLEQPLEVVESTCLAPVTESFAEDLASRPPCEQIVELLGETAVAVEDCTGTRVEGTLDRDGTIRVAYPPASDTVAECTVDLATSAVIPAGADPTTATYTFDIDFSGDDCPLSDCRIEAEGTWAKQ